MFLWNENSKTDTAETRSPALWSSSRMTSTVKQVLYKLLHIQKCSYQNDLFLWILKLNLILKINKGSVTGFHSVLGCRGCVVLGALLWLFFSFFAMNIPERFSEVKFLVFSILVFCRVWVTFLPVHHSTKQKVMMAVKVFSILISSAELLGCIFVLKCYIILIRPDSNSLKKYRYKLLYWNLNSFKFLDHIQYIFLLCQNKSTTKLYKNLK